MSLGTATIAHVKSLSAENEDGDLALRFARAEPLAFEAVVALYRGRVTALASRLLAWHHGAEDVAQEVFLAALRNQRRFRGDSSLWTWLATMTVNRCRSLHRRRWLQEKFLAAAGMARPRSNAPAADQGVARDETAAQVRAAVGRLPGTSREVVVLHYLEELSISQIATMLGQRRNTVEVRLSRAKKLLEPWLAGLMEGHD